MQKTALAYTLEVYSAYMCINKMGAIILFYRNINIISIYGQDPV